MGAYGGSGTTGEGGLLGREGRGGETQGGEAARPSARPRTGRLQAAVRAGGGVASTGELSAPGDTVEGPGPAGAGRAVGHHQELGRRG